MASITTTAPVFGGTAAATALSRNPGTTACRGSVMVKAVRVPESGDYAVEETGTKRRDLVFSAAVAVACSVAKIAVAEEEPKRGTEEAKKKYGPVCVTMPTARVCHK